MKILTFKHKFLALLACLSVLSFSGLQAQITVTQADVATLNTTDVTIDAGSDDVIVDPITLQNNGNTAYTLTIKTTGNITISGNVDLTGVAGAEAPTNPANNTTLAMRTGKNGHNLVITADGSITISGTINTSGGAAASAPSGYLNERKGGNAGNAGNINITSNNEQITINSIIANGGNGGNSNQEAGAQAVGAPGKAGNITIQAEKSVSTTGTIIANAGNTGQNVSPYSNDAVSGVPLSANGGTIEITSNNAFVNIDGAITANGGNGTGQATSTITGANNNRNKASTDGGKGGTVNITSCSDLILTAAITVNGGLPGVPAGSPNASTIWNQAGSGGDGGTVTLMSKNDNVTTVQIQANAANGQDATSSMQGTNEGNSAPYNGRADHAGWGGNGGKVEISAEKGTLTVNNTITANAGNGGNNGSTSSCGGSGGNGGEINLTAGFGDETAIVAMLSANGGTKGTDILGNAFQCVEGQAGTPGTIPQPIIIGYTPPTLSGTITIACDPITGLVTDTQITETLLESYLSDYTKNGTEHWEYNNGTGWQAFLPFPITITECNKEEYKDAEIRLVYVECSADKYVKDPGLTISIPCVHTPPTLSTGQINVSCDPVTGLVLDTDITETDLDALLSYTMSGGSWEYNDGTGWQALTLPLSITECNKADYDGAEIRYVYTICTEEKYVESVTISIPCVPTPPTISGFIEVECDIDGLVIEKEITQAMLDALVSYSMPGARWEYNDGNGWQTLTLPIAITEDNKEEYSSYIRMVYEVCGVEHVIEGQPDINGIIEDGLIYIPCVPVPSPDVIWPNAIVPEQGGLNSLFPPLGIDFKKITIFNRYGILIYEGTTSWNGTYDGKMVDPTTYYYVVELPDGKLRKAAVEVVKEK